MATNFVLTDGMPTLRIQVESPEEFRDVEHGNDFRLFQFPGAAVLSWVLKLTTPASETLAVHHAFDLTDGPTREYLDAVSAKGKLLLAFEGSADQKTEVSVGTAKLSRLVKQGLEYNSRLTATNGAEAVQAFLDLFDPVFRERGAEAAWAKAALGTGIVERPKPGDAKPVQSGTSADLSSGSQTTRTTDRRRKPAPADSSSDAGSADTLPFEPLLQSARPDLYRRNAFRIAELPVDVSSRDLDKRQRLVEMAAQTGAAVPTGPFRALPIESPVSAELFRDAITRLRDPGQRILDELFWLWPTPGSGGKPDEAMLALRDNDARRAIELWSGDGPDREMERTRSHNLAVLHHALALDAEAGGGDKQARSARGGPAASHWEKAFEHWKEVLGSDGFWDRLRDRIRDLNDPRLPTSVAGRIRRTLPAALVSINAHLAVDAAQDGRVADAERHSRILSKSGFDPATIDEAMLAACGPLRDRIEVLCAAAAKEYDETPGKGDQTAERLLSQAAPLLGGIDALFPAGHLVRSGLRDEVAVHALIAAVQFGNLKENEGKEDRALKILDRALSLAEGEEARQRIQRNIDIVRKNQQWAEENKDYLQCWFCKIRPPEKGCEATVDMHGNVNREFAGYNKTKYTWERRTLPVPRCSRCREFHQKADGWGNTSAVIGFLAVAGVFVYMIVDRPKEWVGLGCGGFFASAIGAGVLAVIGKSIGEMVSPADVKREGIKEKFPSVLELKKQGWELGAKPAGVS